MRIVRIILLVALFWLLVGVVQNSSAQMQPGNQAMLQFNLTQLEEQIKFLKQINRQFPDPALEKIINQSQLHLNNAREARKAGNRILALAELKTAQNLVEQGLKMVVAGPTSQMLQQVNEKIKLAENALRRNFNQQAQKLLQNALQSRDRALSLRRKNIQKMMEWLRLAQFQIDNCLKMLGHSAVDVSLNVLVREEQNTFHDLEMRVRNMMQANPSNLARRLYNQALAQAKKAQELYDQGNMKQSIETYRWAARLLWRVVDLTGATEVNWQQQAREELQLTREFIRTANQTAKGRKNELLNKVLRQATRIYLDAEHSFEQKKYPEAVRKAEYARRLVNRARMTASTGEKGDYARLATDLETLEQVLQDLGSRLQGSRNETAQKLLEMARRYASRSHEALDARRMFQAKGFLFLATRFGKEVQALLSNQVSSNRVQQLADQKTQEFLDGYQSILKTVSKSQNAGVQTWLNLAKELTEAVKVAEKEHNYSLQLMNARVGLQVLKRLQTILQ